MHKKTTQQITRIIRRIPRNKTGMTEEDTLRLVRALVVSRVAYSLPYHRLNKQEIDQIETILRGAYKTAIGLSQCTATSKLQKLGVTNTFEEIKEATLIAHKQRLQLTRTGRAILERVGTPADKLHIANKVDLDKDIRRKLFISPIPRHMDKTAHQGRRKARTAYLEKKLHGDPNTLYTDAAIYTNNRDAVAAVIYSDHNLIECLTIKNTNPEEAEAAAIALGFTHGERQQSSPAHNYGLPASML
ncbi:hypothetical protein HPB48_016038 [Haemaphysalis longicornis]|uniref:Tick transposon n=1 Tax=Haemaphysalis longicornis TaxID=44386 RepID=A0A9J6GUM3_HAELO|nr:hypothetical protein HPB48_016038 [Haemaphysalis longicornis]